MKKVLLFVALALLGLALAPIAQRALAPTEVASEVIAKGLVRESVYATGRVEARVLRKLRGPRRGTVARIDVKEGDEVRVGAPLLRLENRSLEARQRGHRAKLALCEAMLAAGSAFRATAQARIEEVSAELAHLEGDLGRARELLAKGSGRKDQVIELEARARAMVARRQAIAKEHEQNLEAHGAERLGEQAALDALHAEDLDDGLTSPIDGVVLSVGAEPGEVVGTEAELLRIGDIRELIIQAEVDEDDLANVRIGQEVLARFSGSTGAVVPGELEEILPDIVAVTRSARVKITLKERRFEATQGRGGFSGVTRTQGGLEVRSGMSVELGIVTARRDDALTVARGAVTSRGTVFVIADDRLHERAVVLGVRDFRRCEVRSGLREGERVVSEGVRALRDGMRVHARPGELAPP